MKENKELTNYPTLKINCNIIFYLILFTDIKNHLNKVQIWIMYFLDLDIIILLLFFEYSEWDLDKDFIDRKIF